MATVKLQSSDGEVFEVEADVAKVSVTIKNMLDGEGDESVVAIYLIIMELGRIFVRTNLQN